MNFLATDKQNTRSWLFSVEFIKEYGVMLCLEGLKSSQSTDWMIEVNLSR